MLLKFDLKYNVKAFFPLLRLKKSTPLRTFFAPLKGQCHQIKMAECFISRLALFRNSEIKKKIITFL